MRKSIKTLLLFLSLCSAISSAITGYAIQMNALYRAEVPILSQSTDKTGIAQQQALQQVFIKVSGDSSIVNLNVVQAALAHPDRYIQSYNYVHKQLPNGDAGYFLQAKFNSILINKLLLNNNQTLWGRNRPLVLIWLAIQNDSQSKRELVSNDTETGKLFISDANSRGLPTLFPLFDLTDMQTVAVNDIWNPNPVMIRHASKRYGSDAILTGRIQRVDDTHWNAHWLLLAQGNQTVWDNSAANREVLISAGIDAVTDTLAVRYGLSGIQTSQGEGHLQITIVNIKDLSQYAKVSAYLKNLTPVKQIEVVQIEPSSIVYDINVVGGKFAFLQALSLDHRLKPVVDNNNADNSINMDKGLVYQWIS